MHHEHQGFGRTCHRIDESPEISAVSGEAIGIGTGRSQLGGIAHADQIRHDQPAQTFQLGDNVAPEIGRGRIAVQEQHGTSLAAFVIGHAGVKHIDEFFAERLFGHFEFP